MGLESSTRPWFLSLYVLVRATLTDSILTRMLKRGSQYTKSLLVPASQPLSLATWNSFTNFSYSVPPLDGMGWFIEIDAFGGSYNGKKTAIPRVPDLDTAFNGRDSVLLLQLYVSVPAISFQRIPG